MWGSRIPAFNPHFPLRLSAARTINRLVGGYWIHHRDLVVTKKFVSYSTITVWMTLPVVAVQMPHLWIIARMVYPGSVSALWPHACLFNIPQPAVVPQLTRYRLTTFAMCSSIEDHSLAERGNPIRIKSIMKATDLWISWGGGLDCKVQETLGQGQVNIRYEISTKSISQQGSIHVSHLNWYAAFTSTSNANLLTAIMITIVTRLVKWRRYNLRLLDVPVRLKDHTVGIVELKRNSSERVMVKAWHSEVDLHQSVVHYVETFIRTGLTCCDR